MRVHVIQTGRIEFKGNWLHMTKRRELLGLLWRRGWEEIPIVAYVVEHPDGHIVIDTGIHHSLGQRRLPPVVRSVIRIHVEPDEEIGPQMRSKGLRPEDVRLVVPTHLDVDHAGGVGHFPNAEILVHRPEYDYASTRGGKLRYQPQLWPDWFKPKLYDLEPEPLGPFPTSLTLTDSRDVKLVEIAGHSIAQVAVLIKQNGLTLFFGGDHMIRQTWFAADLREDRYALQPYMGRAIRTTKRIKQFVEDNPTIILPSHDADAEANLVARETIKV